MTLKEYLINLLNTHIENKNTKEKYDHPGNDIDFSKIEENVFNRMTSQDNISLFIDLCLERFDSIEKLNNYIDQVSSDKEYNKNIIKLKSLSDYITDYNSTHEEKLQPVDIKTQVTEDLLSEYLKTEDDKKFYFTKLRDRVKESIFPTVLKNNLFAADIFDATISTEEKNNIFTEYENSRLTKDNYVTTKVDYENEINELIGMTNGDVKKNLEYVKENVLTTADKASTKRLLEVSENFGTSSSHALITTNIEQIKNNELNNLMIWFTDTESDHIRFSELEEHNPIEIQNSVLKNKYQFSDKTKRLLKEGLELIDSLKEYNSDKPLLDMDNYISEEGGKVYSLKNLINIRQDIVEAIKTKDIDKINNLATLHKKASGEIDKLIGIAKQFDSDLMPENISCSRNTELSTKYTKDYINVSRVNGLWFTLAFIKSNNLTIDEFINDPVKCIIDSKKPLAEGVTFNKFAQKGDIEFIKTFSDSAKTSQVIGDILNHHNATRPIDFLNSIDRDYSGHNIEVGTYLLRLCDQAPNNKINEVANSYFGSKIKQTIKNIIIAPTHVDPATNNKIKDYFYLSANNEIKRDLITGKAIEPFNYESRIQNGQFSIDDVLSSINNLKTNVNELSDNINFKNLKTAIKGACKEVYKDLAKVVDMAMYKEYADVVQATGESSIDCFKRIANNRDITSYCTNKINTLKANNEINTEKGLTFLGNTLQAINEKYNRRTWFGQVFRPMAHNEKNARASIINELRTNNVSEQDIQNLLNGSLSVNDMVKNYVDSPNVGNNNHGHGINNKDEEKIVINELNKEKVIERKSSFITQQKDDIQLEKKEEIEPPKSNND